MDDRFFNAIIGASSRVCGYEINALSPWHHLILQALNSPVLTPDKETSAGDLLLFLKVVSCQWPHSPNLDATWKDRIWYRRLKKSKILLRELDKLKEWLEAQLSSPVLWQKEDNDTGRSLSSPSVFALVVGLVSKGNMTLDAAWNMRIAEARWYDVTLAELNGADLRIAYENEDEQIKERLQEVDEETAVTIAKRNLSQQDFERWHKSFKDKNNGGSI